MYAINKDGNFATFLSKGCLKGPLKYLVAKLHRCYPGAISLPVSQIFFRALFPALARRRFKSLINFFTSLQQTQKTLFAFICID